MQQQKTQSKYVPVRVHIRPSAISQSTNGHEQNGHELITSSLSTTEKPNDARRAKQIKGLLRLGTLLRAGLSLNEFLYRVATAITECTGFRMVVVNIIEEGSDYAILATSVGVTEEGERVLRENPASIEQLYQGMLPDFRISNSYFIPHEHHNVVVGATFLRPDIPVQENVSNAWHPEDYFFESR